MRAAIAASTRQQHRARTGAQRGQRGGARREDEQPGPGCEQRQLRAQDLG